MNKKLIYTLVSVFGGIYLLFLLLPFFLIPLCDTLSSKISSQIEQDFKFKLKIDKLRLITTPKLTAGVKVSGVEIYEPNDFLLAQGENIQVKLSLIPLLFKKIELDVISADKINLNLALKKDGHLQLEDYFLQNTSNKDIKTSETAPMLPFGLKLSNKMPDFKLKNHDITFVDLKNNSKYSFVGNNTKVSDFIINKHVKISSLGKIIFVDKDILTYDISITNKIMPDIDINSLLVPKEETAPQETLQFEVNLIDIFSKIRNKDFSANLFADLLVVGDLSAPEVYGKMNLDKFTFISGGKKLPENDFTLDTNKDKMNIQANIFTGENENTKLDARIKTGKNPDIYLNCVSNATLGGIFDVVKTFADVFGINELKTLSAKGNLDANFYLKTNLKKISSYGFLKLNDGSINYGAYGVNINKIFSDITVNKNSLSINKLSFSTLGVPLNITGKILQDATADINIQTSNLPIKGLLVSLGQGAILKENPISQGTVSMLVEIKDKLTSPKIEGKVNLNRLALKNIPSNTSLSIPSLNLHLNATAKGFAGDISSSDIKIQNPALNVTCYKPQLKIDEKTITLSDMNVLAGKNKFILNGAITDYLTEKSGVTFNTKGALLSKLTGSIQLYKGLLNLNYAVLEPSNLIIPGFDLSKVSIKGNVDITGNMINPYLKGQFSFPSISIPEALVEIKNMVANLNGTILNGSFTADEFTSGGIKAKNIKSQFKLSGNDFYLNKLEGNAFDGTFAGDVIYNIANSKCKVKISGKNMNALKAIEGGAGIKNALSGTLSFGADVSLVGVEYNDMIKSLKGSADFEIKNGVLANLGGLKTLLNAQNIIQNQILKTTVQSASKLSVVQQTSEFEYINGHLTFGNSYVYLSPVKMAGPMMSYYVNGKSNMLNFSTNVVILGRLSKNVVDALGSVGQFAVSKLSNSLSGFGTLTSVIAKKMNVSPKTVDVTLIPSLTSKSIEYKDFKVEFNGGIESANSVKSFRWINDVDTSELDKKYAAVKENVESVKTQINQTKEQIKNSLNTSKANAKEQAQNLLKSLIVPKNTEN